MCIMSCLFSSNGYSIKKCGAGGGIFAQHPLYRFARFYLLTCTVFLHILYTWTVFDDFTPCTVFSLNFIPMYHFFSNLPPFIVFLARFHPLVLFSRPPCTKIGIFYPLYQNWDFFKTPCTKCFLLVPPVPKWAFPPPPHFLME